MAQPPKSAAPFGGSFLSNHRQELMKIWKTERETSPATILPALFHFRIHFFLTYEKCLWFYQKKTVTMNILDKLFHVLYPPHSCNISNEHLLYKYCSGHSTLWKAHVSRATAWLCLQRPWCGVIVCKLLAVLCSVILVHKVGRNNSKDNTYCICSFLIAVIKTFKTTATYKGKSLCSRFQKVRVLDM